MEINFRTECFKDCGYNESAYPEPSIDPLDDPYIRIDIYDGNRYLGDLVMVKTKYGFWETHCSGIPHDYKGKGLGIALYKEAIKEAKKRKIKLRSSLTTSPEAIRVWKSRRLRKQYRIVKQGNRYVVHSRRLRKNR